MIAYYFPPSSEGGVYRTLRFAKYLSIYGWRPTVLTIKDGIFGRVDQNLLNEIPGTVEVIRSYSLEVARFVKRFSKHSSGVKIQKSGGNANTTNLITNKHRGLKSNLFHLGKRSINKIENFMEFPDRKIGWFPYAVKAGKQVHSRHPVDVIYSSGSPWTGHLIGACLKYLLRVPWVADYRDFWTLYRDPNLKISKIRLRVEDILERRLMHYSDMNIFVNEQTRDGYLRKYSDLSPNRMRILSNGFDPADFTANASVAKNDKLVILHTGTASVAIYALDPFFRAVRNWVDENPTARDKLRIRFIGELGDNIRFIEEYRLEQIVTVENAVPHHEATRLMQGASVLLVVLGNHPPETRAMKTLEYIGAGRPIWAVAVEGATTEIVRSSGCGWISHPQDVNAIKRALDDIWLSFSKSQLKDMHPLSNFVAHFNGEKLTGQLACWLDELAG